MRCTSARMASAVSMGVSAGMENVGAADGIKHARTALSMSPQSMMFLRVCRGCRRGRVGVRVGQKCVCAEVVFFAFGSEVSSLGSEVSSLVQQSRVSRTIS